MLATTIKKWEKDLIQEGLHKGKLEGKLECKREIARNPKRKGLSLMEIAEVTGLSVEKILTLRFLQKSVTFAKTSCSIFTLTR